MWWSQQTECAVLNGAVFSVGKNVLLQDLISGFFALLMSIIQ